MGHDEMQVCSELSTSGQLLCSPTQIVYILQMMYICINNKKLLLFVFEIEFPTNIECFENTVKVDGSVAVCLIFSALGYNFER